SDRRDVDPGPVHDQRVPPAGKQKTHVGAVVDDVATRELHLRAAHGRERAVVVRLVVTDDGDRAPVEVAEDHTVTGDDQSPVCVGHRERAVTGRTALCEGSRRDEEQGRKQDETELAHSQKEYFLTKYAVNNGKVRSL